ncbi:MAG TPA: DinB family protein [Longimicrobiaceae bacterium]|nr:DinB family protein [Longimicrobiaceae bacterium]
MSVFTNAASGGQEQAREYTRAVLDLVGGRDPLGLLDSTPSEARRTIRGLTREQLRTPEAPGKWSVQHVVQHLADSDMVWGNRLRLVLSHEKPVLTGYDQDLWANRLRYDESDPEEALNDFTELRAMNLRLLRRAERADWVRVGIHVERGEESVEHMVRLYAGHDVLHLRQLERIARAVS